MTEEEWLTGTDPTAILLFIKGHRRMRKPAKQRRQRLAAAAFCRRLPGLMTDSGSLRCIEVAENFTDGVATADERAAAEDVAKEAWLKNTENWITFACLQLCRKEVDGLYVSTLTIEAAFIRERQEAHLPYEPLGGRRKGACPSEEKAQTDLLRDIFGNPFRPVAFDPAWRSEAAVGIARGIYDERAFERMPILADALQDTGCENADILAHCREAGTHVRGCWVVDLVLGKE